MRLTVFHSALLMLAACGGDTSRTAFTQVAVGVSTAYIYAMNPGATTTGKNEPLLIPVVGESEGITLSSVAGGTGFTVSQSGAYLISFMGTLEKGTNPAVFTGAVAVDGVPSFVPQASFACATPPTGSTGCTLTVIHALQENQTLTIVNTGDSYTVGTALPMDTQPSIQFNMVQVH